MSESESAAEDGVMVAKKRDSERTFSSLSMKMDGGPPSLFLCYWEVIDGLQKSKVTETKLGLPLSSLCVLPFSQGVWGGLGGVSGLI